MIDTRPSGTTIRRSGKCNVCQGRFTTREIHVSDRLSPEGFEILLLLAGRIEDLPEKRRRLVRLLLEELVA
jgi:hypothetical protein